MMLRAFRRASRRTLAAARCRPARIAVESLETRELLAASFSGTVVLARSFAASLATIRENGGPGTAAGPTIVEFGGVQVSGTLWTVEGQVLGDDVVGLVVQFGGMASLEGKTAVVEDDGWFYLTLNFQPGECGTATAQTTDRSGNVSNLAEAPICQMRETGSQVQAPEGPSGVLIPVPATTVGTSTPTSSADVPEGEARPPVVADSPVSRHMEIAYWNALAHKHSDSDVDWLISV